MAGEIRDAQERGEVARQNRHPGSVRTSDTVPATLDSLNLDRRRVAEWRDTAEAGEVVVERAIQGALDEGRAAQERGEVARKEDGRPVSARSTGTSTPVTASAPKPAKLSELGLDSRRLSEWRRTAEAAKPTCPIPAVLSPVQGLRPFPAATYCQRAAARPGAPGRLPARPGRGAASPWTPTS